MSDPSRAFHLSLNVADLERAVDFYRVLFGSEPARHETDYAKFEVADPPLVLALEPRAASAGGTLNHVGIRVSGHAEVEAMQDRLATMGIDAQFLSNVACCYSHQTKICTWDPDGTMWEVYVLEEDGASREATAFVSAAATPRVSASASPVANVVRQHLLGEQFPALDAEPAAIADEVHLRGTLNAPLDAAGEAAILASALRALKPGGRLEIHMMVGDRPVGRALPTMPGPAARVERVPVASDVLRAVEDAGFVALECRRYSHSPVYRFDGVEMRELLLSAQKRADASGTSEERRAVLYKGPFRDISDDDGVRYPRGEQVFVGVPTFDALRRSSLAEHFVFVTTDAGGCAPDGCG